MRFASVHKAITYLFSGLGLVALSLGDFLSTPFLVLMAGAFVISAFAEGPILERRLYTRLWTGLVVLFFFMQVARGLLGEAPLVLGLEYAAVLQVSRLFNRRTARDHQQIAILALMHLIAATLLSTELSYAAVFVGFVVVTPWMLAISHLRREIENNYGGGAQAAGSRASADPNALHVARVLASKRLLGARFLLGTSLLSVPLFLVTAGLFLLVPRIGVGVLSFGAARGQSVAGFGSNVELGGFGRIRDDPSVVMRVTLPGLGKPTPSAIALRLRGTSFDHYDGQRWTRSVRAGEMLPNLLPYLPLRRMPDGLRDRPVHIELEHLDEPVIFIPEGSVALDVPPRLHGGFAVTRNLYLSPGLDLRYLDADELGLRYTAWVAEQPDAEGGEFLAAGERERYLALPDGLAQTRALARRVARGASSDAERAQRVLSYLRDGGEYRYSLDQPDVASRDPLEVFLFEAKRGHCEYFSTAMAVMLRATGVPARNVTGFVGGDLNPYGDYYSIRRGDAHSWVEAHLDGRGWVTFDPTPASPLEAFSRSGPLDALRNFFDAVGRSWSDDIVGYDLGRQIDLATRFGSWLRSLSSGQRRGIDPVAGGASTPHASRNRAPGLLIGASALMLTMGLLMGWLRRRRVKRAGPTIGAARNLYAALESALRRDGSPRPPSRTPSEHAEYLRAKGHEQADLIDEVTRAYLAIRFGDRMPSADLLSSLHARIRGARWRKHRKTAPDRLHR